MKWGERGGAGGEVFADEVDATKARGEVFTTEIKTISMELLRGN